MTPRTTAVPDGTGTHGTGHRCEHCGERIDVAHTSDPSGSGWVHDETGARECTPVDIWAGIDTPPAF